MMIYGDKKKLMTSVLGPSGEEIRPKESPSDSPDELRLIARELIEAVHAKDTDGVVDSLRAAFECMDLEPEEGESAQEE